MKKDYTALTYHLKGKHPEEWKECQEKRDSKHQRVTDDNKNLKQLSIKTFVSNSVVKNYCVGIAVNSAIPFTVFDTPDMKSLIQDAAAHNNEKIIVNSSNMKTLVLKKATDMKEKIAGLLKHRFVNLQIDMATCQAKSFFGKENFIKSCQTLI